MLAKKIEMENADLPGQPIWAMPPAVPGLMASGWSPVDEKVSAQREADRAAARIREATEAAEKAMDAVRATQKAPEPAPEKKPEPAPKAQKKNTPPPEVSGPPPAPQGADSDLDPSAGTSGSKE